MSSKSSPVSKILILVCLALAILYVDAERRRRNYRERVLDVVRELATYTESTAQETLQFEHRDWRDVVPEVQ
ncbi:MAG TPA: hypothetical protein VHF69_00555, partial [Candidatus Synoicihabitans sp.]|nr:hypothetical protein [Candidatus Synoicihabitans sp.]